MISVRLATRGSPLALAQTALAFEALRRTWPDLDARVVEVRTEGDENRRAALYEIGGRGVFVRAIEQALLDGRADAAVHSLKDMPTAPADGLVIAAVLERGDPRDALVAPAGRRLADLPPGARVGTGSRRRALLLRALRPDLVIEGIRGNVETRMKSVASGGYDAVVLAAAGLQRLGRLGEATQLFEAIEFLPAPGQGAIALQCRADDEPTRRLLSTADHAITHAAVDAERGFLAALGTGCELPVGAFGQLEDGLLTVRAMLGGATDAEPPRFGDATGSAEEAYELGRSLGERLLAMTAEGAA